jgi:hypothetical protein
MLAQRRGEMSPERRAPHQHVGAGLRIADVPGRHAQAHERRHVEDRLQRDVRAGKGNDRVRVVVDDRHHVRARLVDLAVDEALVVDRAALRIDGIAVEVVLEDVRFDDQLRRDVPRHEVALGIPIRAHARMAVCVDHAVLGEGARCDHEIQREAHFILR